ncbi:hypothetical protein BKA69DRAFT_1049276 [Paraphysoderma sedebokerense]|nr:hypothetical protein BKA69DRAFT_1049276 [Paraphysoderma sedebokerense]
MPSWIFITFFDQLKCRSQYQIFDCTSAIALAWVGVFILARNLTDMACHLLNRASQSVSRLRPTLPLLPLHTFTGSQTRRFHSGRFLTFRLLSPSKQISTKDTLSIWAEILDRYFCRTTVVVPRMMLDAGNFLDVFGNVAPMRIQDQNGRICRQFPTEGIYCEKSLVRWMSKSVFNPAIASSNRSWTTLMNSRVTEDKINRSHGYIDWAAYCNSPGYHSGVSGILAEFKCSSTIDPLIPLAQLLSYTSYSSVSTDIKRSRGSMVVLLTIQGSKANVHLMSTNDAVLLNHCYTQGWHPERKINLNTLSLDGTNESYWDLSDPQTLSYFRSLISICCRKTLIQRHTSDNFTLIERKLSFVNLFNIPHIDDSRIRI